MRRRMLVSALAVSISTALACGSSGNSGSQTSANVAQAGAPAKIDKTADEAALRAIYLNLPALLAKGDAAAMAAQFADDGAEIMAGMPPATGTAAVSKLFSTLLGSMKGASLTMSDIAVTVGDAGDLAVVQAPYRMTYTGADGRKIDDHGRSMTVFKKVNGQWKILYDTNISEMAPPG